MSTLSLFQTQHIQEVSNYYNNNYTFTFFRFPQSLDPGHDPSSSGRVISKSIARVSLPFPQSLDSGPGTSRAVNRRRSKHIILIINKFNDV